MPNPPSITINVRPFGELGAPGGAVDQTPIFLGTSESGATYEPQSSGSYQGVVDVAGLGGTLRVGLRVSAQRVQIAPTDLTGGQAGRDQRAAA